MFQAVDLNLGVVLTHLELRDDEIAIFVVLLFDVQGLGLVLRADFQGLGELDDLVPEVRSGDFSVGDLKPTKFVINEILKYFCTKFSIEKS